jgi:hypothetical protein
MEYGLLVLEIVGQSRRRTHPVLVPDGRETTVADGGVRSEWLAVGVGAPGSIERAS